MLAAHQHWGDGLQENPCALELSTPKGATSKRFVYGVVVKDAHDLVAAAKNMDNGILEPRQERKRSRRRGDAKISLNQIFATNKSILHQDPPMGEPPPPTQLQQLMMNPGRKWSREVTA